MEKLPLCRMCLVANVRILVVNKNLQEVYEKLTDIPFVTEDRRPMLACFFCCAKLKQCYRLLRQCLEAEKLFAQVMNEDYEPNLLLNHLEVFSGFIKSPTENISIVDVRTESIAIKEELPAVSEGLDDTSEPKEEHQSHELESEYLGNSYLDVADKQTHHSESDLEDDVPLMEFKTEVEEHEVSKNKRRAREATRATAAKKPKLDTRRTELEDAITAEHTKKEKSDSKVVRITRNRASKPGTYFKEPYKCDQRSLNPVKKKIQHSRTQIGASPYKCDVCQRSFSEKRYLTKHKRIHTGEKPYKCDVCQRSFSENSTLTKHIRQHTGEKPYNCDVCQRSFSEKGVLIKHIRVHTGEKPFKCDICERSFRQLCHLKKHILIHTGEKPYKCDVCQRSFSEKGHLSQHIRIHTGENPYKCDECQRSFSQKSHLTIHIRIHTGEKPYKCDICQRNFSQKGVLTNHTRTHTGEKPYKCYICGRCFSSKVYLTKHTRIHTGETP